jgi:hypothetical protein
VHYSESEFCRAIRRLAMMKFVIPVLLAAAAAGGLPFCAAADDVPSYDIRKSCKADVQA